MVGLDFVRVFRNLSIKKEFFWVLEKYWPQELCLSWKNLGSKKKIFGLEKGFGSWKNYLNSGKIWVLEIFCPERSWGLKNSCLKKNFWPSTLLMCFFKGWWNTLPNLVFCLDQSYDFGLGPSWTIFV